MSGMAKVVDSNLTSNCFFFSNGKYSVSNKIVGQLFVCLSVVDLVVASWIFVCAIFLS